MARFTPRDILSSYGSIAALNANFDDIATLMEQALFRNGTAPNTMSADFDMNHNVIRNLGAPTSATDAARLQDLADYVIEGGGLGPELLYVTLDDEDAVPLSVRDILRELPITPEAFGAVGDGVTNDQEAFEKMCAYIQNLGAGNIRMGANKTYRGGRQTKTATEWTPTSMIYLNDIEYVKIDMNGSTLKPIDGLLYGTFDHTSGAVPPPKVITADGYFGNGRAMHPSGIELFEVLDIDIRNGLIDMNSQKALIGGNWGDNNIQLPCYGLRISEYNMISIDNVQVIYSLQDGMLLERGVTTTDRRYPARVTNSVFRFAARNCVTVAGGNSAVFDNCHMGEAGEAPNDIDGIIGASPFSCFDTEAEGIVIRNLELRNCSLISGEHSWTSYVEESGDTANTTLNNCIVEGALWTNKPGFRMIGGELRGHLAKSQADAQFVGVKATDAVLGAYEVPVGAFIATENSVPVGEHKPLFRDCTFSLVDNVINLRDSTLENCYFNVGFDTDTQPDGTLAINILNAKVRNIKITESINPAKRPANGYYVNIPKSAEDAEIVQTGAWLKWFDEIAAQGGFIGKLNFREVGVDPLEFFTNGTNAEITREINGMYRAEKTAGGSGWNAHAYTPKGMEGDFVYRVTPVATVTDSSAGLSIGIDPSASAHYNVMAVNVSLSGLAGSTATVYLLGVSSGTTFTTSTHIYFVRENGILKIYTGTDYLSALAAGVKYDAGARPGAAYGDSSLYTVGSKIDFKMGTRDLFQ